MAAILLALALAISACRRDSEARGGFADSPAELCKAHGKRKARRRRAGDRAQRRQENCRDTKEPAPELAERKTGEAGLQPQVRALIFFYYTIAKPGAAAEALPERVTPAVFAATEPAA